LIAHHREDIDGSGAAPLPKGLSEEKILLAMTPIKDVDSFHPYNDGN
jgi:5,10-methylene-tetrahydrofolate dehydrogenase/methenyl tetrahydrofolate cyclohydrolase